MQRSIKHSKVSSEYKCEAESLKKDLVVVHIVWLPNPFSAGSISESGLGNRAGCGPHSLVPQPIYLWKLIKQQVSLETRLVVVHIV